MTFHFHKWQKIEPRIKTAFHNGKDFYMCWCGAEIIATLDIPRHNQNYPAYLIMSVEREGHLRRIAGVRWMPCGFVTSIDDAKRQADTKPLVALSL